MKIVQVDTLRLDEFPNILFVQVHTDEGLTGLGETFFGARAVEAYVHETAAPYLLGENPLRIDQHAKQLYGYLGYGSSGAETRGNSALDIALWDLFGKVTNQPVYQLLGGACREQIRTYNTCAGYRYVREKPRQEVSNWGLCEDEPEGPYEDLDAFLHRADELAEDLLSQGITGMKIWPFDPYAEASGGHYISDAPNALVQESVRAYYTGWYKELVTDLPTIADGHISPPEGSGLGTELLPDLRERPDAHLLTSKLGGL